MPKKKTNTRVRRTKHNFISISQKTLSFYLIKMKAKDLVTIGYVAARGESDEAGAVQRILNPRRISSIKDYTLKVGSFPSSIILNWVSSKDDLQIDGDMISIPIAQRSAQIIDGQHRVEGIREAIAEDSTVGEMEVPITMYKHLGTRECADIFLSINTEQKPVPKSLVYDLYGLASEYIVDYAANRAKDIATNLNEQDDSPYLGLVKFPGPSRQRGGIALSSLVSAIKPLVAEKGTFEQANIAGLDLQTKVIINYFRALEASYGEKWTDKDNAFIYAAGFVGAIEFLKSRLFDYCVRERSFETETIRAVLKLNSSELILQSELKGLGGSKARQHVVDRLVGVFTPGTSATDKHFKF